jgi:MFS family permease
MVVHAFQIGSGTQWKCMNVRTLLRGSRPVPPEYRSNFRHLYLDIAWYGVLAASAMSFVAVYATRQGASAFQIGLLSAGPAAVNLLFTLPVGHWLEGLPIDASVFWSAVLHRFFYVLWIPLPVLLAPQEQVWALVILTLLMAVPGTALAVGFNALFADAVPPEWRGHVVGIRNALMAVTFIVVSLLCGLILGRLPFPTGYQVVFAIGFVGAAMSCLHLRFVVPFPSGQSHPRVGRSLGDLGRPGRMQLMLDSLRLGAGLRFLIRGHGARLLRIEILKGAYGRLIFVLFAFYLAIHLAVPLFPIQWVNQLHLTDREIALGTAVFYVSVFLSSTQMARLARRLGNRRVTAIGAMFMSFYPAFLAISRGLDLFLVASAAGGLGWSLVGGALTNHLLEKVPPDDRPAYLAWYNLALNAALLLGSLTGPFLAHLGGVPVALMIFAALRFLAALAILRWG